MITRIPNSLLLPPASERWSPLWVEHANIEVDDQAVQIIHPEDGAISVPSAQISCLVLQPGTTITHAAVNRLAECHTPIIWVGDKGLIFYAAGHGWTHTNANAKKQMVLWSNVRKRNEIARRMFSDRFGRATTGGDLQSLRLDEGIQMKKLYRNKAEEYGVPWSGRDQDPYTADPVNKLLTCAYQCLYAMSLSCILGTGRLPYVGFVHESSDMPFVYDIADKYKQNVAVDAAFETHRTNAAGGVRSVREAMAVIAGNASIMESMVSDMEIYLS